LGFCDAAVFGELASMSCLENCFGTLPDPRANNACHSLSDLMVIMLAASLCGAVGATDFALFAAHRRDALSGLISYSLSYME
jgi:DDE_Tnp_1-associated